MSDTPTALPGQSAATAPMSDERLNNYRAYYEAGLQFTTLEVGTLLAEVDRCRAALASRAAPPEIVERIDRLIRYAKDQGKAEAVGAITGNLENIDTRVNVSRQFLLDALASRATPPESVAALPEEIAKTIRDAAAMLRIVDAHANLFGDDTGGFDRVEFYGALALSEELDALPAALAGIAEDGERLDWLLGSLAESGWKARAHRVVNAWQAAHSTDGVFVGGIVTPESVRAAIDAARASLAPATPTENGTNG